jgi:hypothetical protein
MAAEDTYMDQSFIDGVGSLTWQELRPLRDYVGDGSEICLLSAKAYRYYIPAYLVALVDESADQFYLNGVLDSLWHESCRPFGDGLRGHFDPHKGLDETLHELEIQVPHLTDEERMTAAETRVRVSKQLAYLKEITGRDLLDGSSLDPYRRKVWEERMPLLTSPQKGCIARILVHILERTRDEFDAPRIQFVLDKYWGPFPGSGNSGTGQERSRQLNSDSGNSRSSIPLICLRNSGMSSIAESHKICQSKSK